MEKQILKLISKLLTPYKFVTMSLTKVFLGHVQTIFSDYIVISGELKDQDYDETGLEKKILFLVHPKDKPCSLKLTFEFINDYRDYQLRFTLLGGCFEDDTELVNNFMEKIIELSRQRQNIKNSISHYIDLYDSTRSLYRNVSLNKKSHE